MTPPGPTPHYSAEKLFWHVGGSMLVATVILAVIAYGRIPLDARLSYKPAQPSLDVPLEGRTLSAVSELSSVTVLEGTSDENSSGSVSFEQFAGILPKHSADISTTPERTTVSSICHGFLSTPCRYKTRYVLPQGTSVTTEKGPVRLKGTFEKLDITDASVSTEEPITVKTLLVSEANTSLYLEFAVAPERVDIQGSPDIIEITVPKGVTYRVDAPDNALLNGSDLSRDTTETAHTITFDVPKTTSITVNIQDG